MDSDLLHMLVALLTTSVVTRRVPTPPGKSWKVLDFSLKFQALEGPGK